MALTLSLCSNIERKYPASLRISYHACLYPQLWRPWNIMIRAERKSITQCVLSTLHERKSDGSPLRRKRVVEHLFLGQLFSRALAGLESLREADPKLPVPLINKRDHDVPGLCCLWERWGYTVAECIPRKDSWEQMPDPDIQLPLQIPQKGLLCWSGKWHLSGAWKLVNGCCPLEHCPEQGTDQKQQVGKHLATEIYCKWAPKRIYYAKIIFQPAGVLCCD